MKKVLLCLYVLFVSIVSVAASEPLLGQWTSVDQMSHLEILQGFSPNKGVVVKTNTDNTLELGTWEQKDTNFSIQIGWSNTSVSFIETDMMQIRQDVYKRTNELSNTQTVSIKTDQKAFIEQLTSSSWKQVSDDVISIFRSTFALDSGVIERFDTSNLFQSFGTWSIASGVFKLDSTLLINARITGNHLIGLTEYDNFLVYKLEGKAEEVTITELEHQRESFLKALTTDSWITTSLYYPTTTHRFRPVESELKGRLIQTREDRLHAWSSWEFSPATGALKIDYTTYQQAMLLGQTMALIDSSARQSFYRRKPDGANKQFSTADVTSIPLSENNSEKISELLAGQFQYGDYTYVFDFSSNPLNGYIHKFTSSPFRIIGNKFSNDLFSTTQQLYAVEDVVFFDSTFLMKRDTRKVYLSPMTEEEAAKKQIQVREQAQDAMTENLTLRIRTKDGKTLDVDLPISNFSEIVDFYLFVE